jgi:Skp family chaperone for outer membrane proteins
MNHKTLIAAFVAAAVSGATFAQTTPPAGNTNTPVIDKRAANQEKRIEQGKASGQLTTKEAANLDKREAKLNSDIAKAKADGTVTKKERAKLTREENRDSRKIARKKHNAKTQATEPSATK